MLIVLIYSDTTLNHHKTLLKSYLFPNLIVRQLETLQPCRPDPCGSNAVCRERSGAGSCTCLAGYSGDPYLGCRPECVLNADCPRHLACDRNKCKDPCPGTCGAHATCRVVRHTPACSCLPGFTGDPITACVSIPARCKISSNFFSFSGLYLCAIYYNDFHR